MSNDVEKNKIFNIFKPNQISAKLYVDYQRKMIEQLNHQENKEDFEKYLLVYDLYIKARSYAIINKIAFFLAIFFGFLTLVWPTITLVINNFDFKNQLFNSAIIQTTITGISALTFGIYSHYKKRQLLIENLIRSTVYSRKNFSDVKDKIIQEMEKIDAGFSFSDALEKKEKNN